MIMQPNKKPCVSITVKKDELNSVYAETIIIPIQIPLVKPSQTLSNNLSAHTIKIGKITTPIAPKFEYASANNPLLA